jgi:hypothetical protein
MAVAARWLREEPDPYDGDEEPTPVRRGRRLEACGACRGTGWIHVTRGRRDVDHGRRCPFCDGTGARIVEDD